MLSSRVAVLDCSASHTALGVFAKAGTDRLRLTQFAYEAFMLQRFFAVLFLFVVLAGALPVMGARGGGNEQVVQTKTRLLSEALRARDMGNFADARAKLEELQAIAPGDVTVARLLATLGQQSVKKSAAQGGVSSEPENDSSARHEQMRLDLAIEAAHDVVREARRLAANRDYASALYLLAHARKSLPEDGLTQIIEQIAIAKTEISLGATNDNRVPSVK